MDCRTCQPSLIDLLHGELAMEAAEQAHAHIAQCANCRGALDRLERGLRLARQMPLIDPPQAVTARLLQLADESARASAAAQRKPRPSAWQTLLDFIGRFATGRQVGMVTIMLLIVAVGLWSLPQLRHAPVVAGGTVVNPDESAEAAPSTGVEPAQPLDLKVDLRAGRIRSNADAPGMLAELREEEAVAAAAEPVAESARTKGGPEGAPGGLAASRKNETGNIGASRLQRQGGAEAPLSGLRARDSERSAGGLASGAGPQQPAAFPRSDSAARGKSSDDALASASESAAAPAATSAPRKRAEAEASPVVVTEKKSASGFAPPAAAPAPVAMAQAAAPARAADAERTGAFSARSELQAARALARSSGCTAALARYERVVQSAPTSPEAGEALIDMAGCARERGQFARAETLLERAARIPPVARRAAALLAEGDSAAESKAKAKPAAKPAASEP